MVLYALAIQLFISYYALHFFRPRFFAFAYGVSSQHIRIILISLLSLVGGLQISDVCKLMIWFSLTFKF